MYNRVGLFAPRLHDPRPRRPGQPHSVPCSASIRCSATAEYQPTFFSYLLSLILYVIQDPQIEHQSGPNISKVRRCNRRVSVGSSADAMVYYQRTPPHQEFGYCIDSIVRHLSPGCAASEYTRCSDLSAQTNPITLAAEYAAQFHLP